MPSYINGHKVIYDRPAKMWRYEDNHEQVSAQASSKRRCPLCDKPPVIFASKTGWGADACLGIMPGVRAACCGHGIEDCYAYIWYEDGTEVTLPKLNPKEKPS